MYHWSKRRDYVAETDERDEYTHGDGEASGREVKTRGPDGEVPPGGLVVRMVVGVEADARESGDCDAGAKGKE